MAERRARHFRHQDIARRDTRQFTLAVDHHCTARPPAYAGRMAAHARMLQFRIGDRVSFQPEGRAAVVGMLTRYSRKTVTVITEDGHRWNVAPGLLRGAEDSRSGRSASNVVEMPRK